MKIKTLLIDNYDSFSYNLYQYIGEIDPGVLVIRNDEMSVDEIRELSPERIVISPGPGRPQAAGNIIQVIRELGSEIPILGVCLGHQAICAAYGAGITYAKELMHGKSSEISINPACPLFEGCQTIMKVARYHSLAADPDTMPDCLQVAARTDDGEVMAVWHRSHPVYGVQFHPESILTPEGKKIIKNFFTL